MTTFAGGMTPANFYAGLNYNPKVFNVKEYGAVVFKVSNSTLYVCRFIRPTGKKCWFPLN